jgi:hypothetical protein
MTKGDTPIKTKKRPVITRRKLEDCELGETRCEVIQFITSDLFPHSIAGLNTNT